MKHFEVVRTNGSKAIFDFPTSIEEISNEYLEDITKCLQVAENYTLIALAYKPRLSDIILGSRAGKKDTKISVVPLFVKAGKTDIDFINKAKVKQRVITSNTNVSLGIHVALPNHKLTINYFAECVCDTTDRDIYEREIQSGDKRDVIFIEFKLIPNAEIAGLLDNENIAAPDTNYVKVQIPNGVVNQ